MLSGGPFLYFVYNPVAGLPVRKSTANWKRLIDGNHGKASATTPTIVDLAMILARRTAANDHTGEYATTAAWSPATSPATSVAG